MFRRRVEGVNFGRRLKHILLVTLQDVLMTKFRKCLEDVWKTSYLRYFKRYKQHVFKTSSKHLEKIPRRRLQYVLMFSGYCPLVSIFHSRKLNNFGNKSHEMALRITHNNQGRREKGGRGEFNVWLLLINTMSQPEKPTLK